VLETYHHPLAKKNTRFKKQILDSQQRQQCRLQCTLLNQLAHLAACWNHRDDHSPRGKLPVSYSAAANPSK
jgi:hypothetical protein